MPQPIEDNRSDQELVAAINAGDGDAFEAIYWRHRDWAAALAQRFTGDSAMVPDIVQEAFLYLLGKFPGFALTSQLRTFLYPAVRNLSLNARRKLIRLQPTDHEQLDQHEAPAASTAQPSDGRKDELLAVLQGLPEEHRETLWLRFVDGLSLAEVAETLDVPVGTVKSRLHNAVRMLREDPRTKNFFGP